MPGHLFPDYILQVFPFFTQHHFLYFFMYFTPLKIGNNRITRLTIQQIIRETT